MSRIIVKNLPKKITEERVREIFSVKGLVTDVQLKYTADGRFRQFCFVGYQTEEEAKSAIGHFNNTRINTSKVIVELCAVLGDPTKPRAWSKHSIPLVTSSANGESKNKCTEESKSIKNVENDKETISRHLLEKYKDDPLFEEFLEVHDKGEAHELKKIKNSQKPSTADEVIVETSAVDGDDVIVDTELDEVSDLDYLKQLKDKTKQFKEPKQLDLFTLKLRNLPYNTKKRDIKQFFKPLAPFTIRLPRNVKSIAYVAFKQEKQLKKALLKDKSFLNGKQICVVSYNKGNEHTMEDNVKKCKWKEQEESLKNEEAIGESGRIFMRNLSYLTTEVDVEQLFSTYGPVAEVQLPIDNKTRRSKGFGTITFLMPEHAAGAYSRLDGAVLHGRMLHLLPAKSVDTPKDSCDSYKDRKQETLKSNATSSHNWNALFLGADAVAEVTADRHGVNKTDVVLKNDSSAAVRLALAETQLVMETKKYLTAEGVDLTAFTQPDVKRSKTIILVKNLPAHTTAHELKSIFEKFGVIGRIVLPPGGISALIEFLEPSEARKAFTHLAYTKFKHLPLYLQWAPQNSLLKTNVDKIVLEEREEEEIEEDDEEEGTTLFVKNLNFNTSNDSLQQHFSKCGRIKYANVTTKHQGTVRLSLGYGFVRFCTIEAADSALKMLQHSELDGKSLEIKRSERSVQQHIVAGSSNTRQQRSTVKQTGTKILIRNIPFQANLSEVTQLFKVFGEIKAFRLPRKMGTGLIQHRGFGFVDYVTKSDAKKAFNALGESTHLYGRRLVLEWAAHDVDGDNGGVENLRKRTAKYFARSQEETAPSNKRNNKSILNID